MAFKNLLYAIFYILYSYKLLKWYITEINWLVVDVFSGCGL